MAGSAPPLWLSVREQPSSRTLQPKTGGQWVVKGGGASDLFLILEDDVRRAPGVPPHAVAAFLRSLAQHPATHAAAYGAVTRPGRTAGGQSPANAADRSTSTSRGTGSASLPSTGITREELGWDLVLLGYHGGWRGRPAGLSASDGFDLTAPDEWPVGHEQLGTQGEGWPRGVSSAPPAATATDGTQANGGATRRFEVCAAFERCL